MRGLDVAAGDIGPRDRSVEAADSCGGSRKLSPVKVTPYAAKACGKGCKQVTFGNLVELHYEVVGDQLVYIGERGGGYKVYLVDLLKGTEVLLQDYKTSFQGCSLVSTDGKRLAYTCVRSGVAAPEYSRALALYDPQTSVETDLLCIKRKQADNICSPSYLNLGSTGMLLNMSLGACKHIDALFYRFGDKSFSNVSNRKGGVWQTHMSGSKAVWTEERVAWKATQVMLYDSVARAVKRLAPKDGAGQYLPRIEGHQVVWTDHRNGTGTMWSPGNSDIYHLDLKSGKTTQITTHKATQDRPDVWGEWVVWQDWRNSPGGLSYAGKGKNPDIYARNLKTGKEVQLTSHAGRELFPRVDSGRVFFTMLDGINNPSVFMIDLKARLGP